ncbi:pentatricopeptide repeat-containing protein At4g04370 [Dendrobium catenatum]|uniref:Pentatricopeptide repeat-containing protein n=1 Tax=Dendrobium catenatum TaxID=906689 RepID=A0A2I0X778_9ASPA|nr:pentatricopeptide repeat-containing protein At4g04370 [Dendrobium catenatum]PKU83767.1 Pentatricopeptide repeat-containing protein [Dendrobium catenatum]
MKHVRPSHATSPHIKTPPPPPPPTAAAEFRPSNHLQDLHRLPSIATAPSHPNDFPPLLKTCASLSLLPVGHILHQRAVVLGLTAEPYLATSLLHMYAVNGRISDAHRVFDQMPIKNVVPYSALISAYCRSANLNMAFCTYNKMLNDGIRPNSVTLLGLISGISDLYLLQSLHALVSHFGFEKDLIIMNSMMNVYSLCGRADFARMLFDSMPFKDCISWNSMIAGYSRNGEVKSSMDLIHKMRLAGFFPDQQTYGSLLSLFTNNTRCSVQLGCLIQALVITSGFVSDFHLLTSLVSLYLKFGKLDYAFKLFDLSSEKDVVLWTAMISGLAHNDRADEALLVFHKMISTGLTPLNTTIASAVSASAQLGMFRIGASIHGFIVRQKLALDTAAENSLITLYMKCSHMRQGQQLFELMQNRDLVSWNAVVSGFAHNGHLEEAFYFFIRMISVMQTPDTITIVSLLQSCASLGALHQGRSIHNFMIRHELNCSLSMETSLVDMYSKCGDIKTAQKCFNRMLEQDMVSWSVIIAGYGSHGMGDVALRMYSRFLSTEMKPNNVMFLSVLSACSHSGLVSEGLAIFNSMKEEFGIQPWIEHCGCVVDLLCRAGNVEEAFRFFRRMSLMANADVLGIILDACRASGGADLAEEVVKEMIKLKPESSGSYLQLAHNYAAMNCWDGFGQTLTRMRTLGLKKIPGWSFVEVNGSKNTFFAYDASHPQWDDILLLLKTFHYEMKDIKPFI